MQIWVVRQGKGRLEGSPAQVGGGGTSLAGYKSLVPAQWAFPRSLRLVSVI